MCGVNNCVQTYTNYASFRKHLKLKHFGSIIEPAGVSEDDFTDNTSSTDNTSIQLVGDTEIESDSSTHQAALFTLKLREIHKVSQLAMTEIMTEVSTMLNEAIQDLKEKVFTVMDNDKVKVPAATLHTLEAMFKKAHQDPFESLYTEYHRTKYYRENIGLVVSSLLACNNLLYTLNMFEFIGANGNYS